MNIPGNLSVDSAQARAGSPSLLWGLSVSPLVAASLSILVYTLSSNQDPQGPGPYAAFFLSMVVGFSTAPPLVRGRTSLQRGWCVLNALILEGAFACFLVAPFASNGELLSWAGLVLSGYSLASLFALWLFCLPVGHQNSDLFSYACAVLAGFAICLLRTALPPFALGPAFPLLTAIPLFLALGRKRPQPENPDQTLPRLDAPPRALLLFLLAGFGVGLMGHNALNPDYAAGFSGLIALGTYAFRPRIALSLIAEIAAPFMMTGLCLWLLAEPGAPFSIFLTGCILLIMHELGSTHRDLKSQCVMLCAAAALGTAGVALSRLFEGIDTDILVIALIIALIVEEALHRIRRLAAASGAAEPSSENAARHADAEAPEATLAQSASTAQPEQTGEDGASPTPTPSLRPRDISPVLSFPNASGQLSSQAQQQLAPYRLSSREEEVAAFLLENRSVGFICASLNLSQSTVKTHIRHIYEKTGVHSRDEFQLLVHRGASEITAP